jgi:hypothetical protein
MHFIQDLTRASGPVRWVVGFVLVALIGCDSVPGPGSSVGRPPVISAFTYAPAQLDLAGLDPVEVEDGAFEVEFTATAEAADPDGQVDRVVLVVRPPTPDSAPVAFEQMTAAGGSRYEITLPLVLDTGETGNYTVLIYAVDDEGQLSNQAIGAFKLINEGSPPVIESLEVPEVITRPSEGTKEESFIVVVSDEDGISNIAGVVFWNVNRPSDTFSLFDDGESGGDAVAGDGRFTTTVVIASTNSPGVNQFAFQATDRAGLKSGVVVQEVTIQ